MGFFGNSAKESEEIRGIENGKLPLLSDTQLIFLALARLYEGEGLDDDALVCEMYRRAGSSAPEKY